jgi:hypothetical protein
VRTVRLGWSEFEVLGEGIRNLIISKDLRAEVRGLYNVWQRSMGTSAPGATYNYLTIQDEFVPVLEGVIKERLSGLYTERVELERVLLELKC